MYKRQVARHFNHRFGVDVFPEPKPHPLKLRIKGTDGDEKMSKSRNNAIGMLETKEQIWKKLKGAFTDPQRITREIPGRPEVCNIFTMHSVVTPPDRLAEIDTACRTAGIGCGDCKKILAESLEVELSPIRARATELRATPTRVAQILGDGAATCRGLAARTMQDVKAAAGVKGGQSQP